MTVQHDHDQAISAAARTVHDKVWDNHWRKCENTLSPARVIDYVREVRVTAKVNEERLPKELLGLLGFARGTVNDKTNQPIKLSALVVSLKSAMYPAA